MLENKGRLGQDKQRNLPFAIRWDALGQMKQKGHIIRHFHIDHNAPCLPPAIKKKNCITIVSNLSWVLGSSLEKSKTVVMHFFGRGGGGGGNEVPYGLCENGEWCFVCPSACIFLQHAVLYHLNDQLH